MHQDYDDGSIREGLVAAFHRATGCAISEPATVELLELRKRLIAEEAEETINALKIVTDFIKDEQEVSSELWAEVLDGMADLQYVLSGTAVALVPLRNFAKAFMRVHESNMSKLDSDGKVIMRTDGKVLKGPHFKPPVLNDLV
jgi:hypothetical protein